MRYLSEEKIEEVLGQEYEEWINETYTHLEIEDGEIMSFEKWFDNKRFDYEESLA